MAAQEIDKCIDEIFKTVKNVGNKPSWRTMKTRFYDKVLSQRAKEKLLDEFGYEKVCEATYKKKQ